MTRRSRHSLTDNVLRSTRALCVGAAIFLCLFASVSFLYAQGSAPASHSDEKPTFWLVDENGSWRAPLPNWTIEELMRIVDSRKETQTASPWSIQSLDATGSVEGGVARLYIAMTISVADGVVRAPLGMREGVYLPTLEEEESGDAKNAGFHYRGPGSCVFDIDRETGEYVALFDTVPAAEETSVSATDESSQDAAESDTPKDSAMRESRSRGRLRPNFYELELELCFPVERVGYSDSDEDAQWSFAASFPPSLHSQLTLEIPTSDVTISAVKGASADAPTTMSESSSELKLRGLGRAGERVEFSWHPDRRRATGSREETKTVCQVEDASIVAELDTRGVNFDATLPVRVFGGDSDVFLVELPPDATLTPESVSASGSNGVLYETIAAREIPSDETQGRLQGNVVEIRLAQRVSVATLRLKATAVAQEPEQGVNARRPVRALAGFSVVGAQKQFGQLKVTRAQDSDFDVTPIYGASSVLDSSVPDGSEIYSFFSQPFLVLAEAFERETVVDARPEYLMRVGNEELRLRARFQFSVYGSKLRELKLRRNGWRLAKILDAQNVVNQEGVIPSNDRGEAVFPLANPSDGEIVLEVELVHDVERIDDASARCQIALPFPIAARVEPGSVVVLPDADAELAPGSVALSGLSRKTARAFSLKLEIPADARKTPTYYQTALAASGDPDPTFVATIRRLSQEIWVEAKTDAILDEKGAFRVNETLEYRVENEPVETFAFQGSARLFDAIRDRGVKCFVDGRPQNLILDAPNPIANGAGSAVADPNQPPKPLDFETCRVKLDAPKIGECVVLLQYDLDPIDMREGLTNQVRVELFQPLKNENDMPFVSNVLTISAPVGLGLSYAGTGRLSKSAEGEGDGDPFQTLWEVEPRRYSDDGKTESIRCTSLAAEYNARFSAALDTRGQALVAVDRAWIQSWFSKNSRLDRVVWKMECRRDYVDVKLPERCASDRVAVSVNGERLPLGGDARKGVLFHDHAVRIPLEQYRQKGGDVVLEICYVLPSEQDSRGKLVVDFPDFTVDSVWIRRIYWQTIFGRKDVVIVDPKEWTPEFVVKRGVGIGSLFYNRFPTMSQEELCDWCGAAAREPIPQEANVYLYSRFCQTPTPFDGAALQPGMKPARTEPTLKRARLYVASRSVLVLTGSALALILGLAILYLQSFSARVAFIMRGALLLICLIAVVCASLRPLLALLFLQTSVAGIVVTLLAALLNVWVVRAEKNAARIDAEKNHN